MKKSDKKIDNNIRAALTDVCEVALQEIEGFKWITHLVNYNDFPASLSIICVFDNHIFQKKEDLISLQKMQHGKYLHQLIQQHLSLRDINIKNISSKISFSTETDMKKCH